MEDNPSSSDRKPQKWALLIGINEYPQLSQYNLRGCVNDVNAIEQLLTSEQFGFPVQNLLKLTSPSTDAARLATRDNILHAFRTHLVENDGIKKDDIAVIYYSGHGSQIPDEDGDEEDGYDETIVPCDCGPDRSNREDVRDISDDEISLMLDELAERTHNINLFFDSCHSGSVTRALQDAEGEDAQAKARWLPPATYPVTAPSALRTRGGTRAMGPGDWMPLSDGYVAVCACEARERAREDNFSGFFASIFKSNWHGILTYYLLEAMPGVDPDTTYYDIWDKVRINVTKRNRWQNPQIEGAFERKVFGGAALPRKRYVEVTAKDGNTVRLAAGLVHNATVGSRFAIYTRGTQVFGDKAARVAVIKLKGIDAFDSVGEVEQGDIKQIEIGAPAIEIEHDYGMMQMSVHVDGDEAILDIVRQQIKESRLLNLATGEQPSTATVKLGHPLRPNGEEDTRCGKKLRILGSGDGHPLVEPITADNEGPSTVVEKLKHIAEYNNMLAIRNLDPQSRLEHKIKLRLLKVTGQNDKGQELLKPVERNEGGDIVLKVGDRVYLEIENLSDEPLHVAVFDCDSQWAVKPVFPKAGAIDDFVPANSKRRTVRFKVNLPEHQMPLRPHLPLPKEIVKVIATTERVDFRSSWQSGTRGIREEANIEGGRSSLYRLIKLAGGGGPGRATRSLEPDDDPIVKDWTTDEVVFLIST